MTDRTPPGTGGYAEFSRRLHAKALRARVPLVGSLELTSKCNLHCHHCYISGPGVEPEHTSELHTEEMKDLLAEMASAGCLWLLVTGGEPLLRPDFAELYDHARRQGFILTLFTNGTLVDEKIAGLLREHPPFLVEVTIYGASAGTYRDFTGQEKAFDAAVRGIELLCEAGVRLRLKTTISRRNLEDLPAMHALADGLGLEFRYDPVINAGLDGSTDMLEERLTAAEVLELDMSDPSRASGLREFCDRFRSHRIEDPGLLYQCGAGQTSFHVDSRGRLSVCIMSRIPAFDLRKGSFAEAWTEFVPGVISAKRSRETPCDTCPLIWLCGQCPGLAGMETGDPESVVEYLCELAHLRAEALGL